MHPPLSIVIVISYSALTFMFVGMFALLAAVLTKELLPGYIVRRGYSSECVGPRQEAEARGLKLLKEWMSPDQLSVYEAHQYFDVVGCDSGKRYRIYHGMAPPNVYEIDDAGRLKMGLCFMPLGRLVAGDVILAQKIALETDEHSALNVANRISPSRELLRSRSL